jgi:NADH:ubiquinone oxidoreductase subunit E
MKPSPYAPRRHIFVCTHRRAEGDPLGTGCGERGDAVFDALKAEVRHKRAFDVWITRTGCMGVCPQSGCTVASTENESLMREVTAEDVERLIQ